MNKLISIIIPYYNKIHTIHRSVKCVLDQSYGNWELIIIDDASDISLFEVFGEVDRRIQIFVNEVNLGPGGTRQRGLEIANGEFITFLDADDFWDDKFLESSLACFNDSIAGVWSKTFVLGNNIHKLKNFNEITFTSIQNYLINYGHPICTSSFLWRKVFLPKWSNLSTQQDSMFELEVSFVNDSIAFNTIGLVYQDKLGDEHREKYVNFNIDLLNKHEVYKRFYECYKYDRNTRLKLFLWFFRIYRMLKFHNYIDDSKIVRKTLISNYGNFPDIVFRGLELFLFFTGINIAFGKSLIFRIYK